MDPIVVRTLGIFEEHSGSRRSIPVPFTKLTTPKINSFHQLDNHSRFEFQVVHSKLHVFVIKSFEALYFLIVVSLLHNFGNICENKLIFIFELNQGLLN